MKRQTIVGFILGLTGLVMSGFVVAGVPNIAGFVGSKQSFDMLLET